MCSPFYLKELLRSEIELSQQGALVSELIGHGMSIPQLIGLFEEKTLSEVYAHANRLNRMPAQQMAEDFIKAKRGILDSLSWLRLFQGNDPSIFPNALDITATRYVEDVIQQLTELMAEIDQYVPQVIDIRKQQLPIGYEKTSALALSSMEQMLREDLHSHSPPSEAQSKVQYVLETFLRQQQHSFQQITAYANAHQQDWEEEVVKHGRGLYITDSAFSFPLIYSVKGNLYVLMEIASHYLGQGKQKIAYRTANLRTGEIEALIKPKHYFLETDLETNKAEMRAEDAFWDTWRDADMLMQFQGKQGILQLHDRLVFDKSGTKSLFLFEKYYRGRTLGRLLSTLGQESAPLSFNQKCALASDILQGLKHIHDANLIHHDIKPSNILLTTDSGGKLSAVIGDLNIACYTYDQLIKSLARVVPNWCAPEYAQVQKDPLSSSKAFEQIQTKKMDVWAVGLIFFILFNQHPLPWQDLEEESQILEIISTLKSGWIPHYPQDERYFPLLEKMLEVDPMKRCTTAEALQELQMVKRCST